MYEQQSNYFSYLLRVWKDSVDGEWHASLKDVINGESHHYPSLYELYVNLWELTSQEGNKPERNPFEIYMKQNVKKLE